jgi:lysozyme
VIPGVDVSHHQGAIDWPAVAASGWAFAVIKATEGTGYVDPALAANRAGARAAGLVTGLYHFARAGDPVAEANYFASTVGALSAGEFIALDWEVQAANPVAWCKAWLDRATACLGPRPLIYLNQSTMASYDWAPVAADSGLWEAKYDGSPSAPVTAHWAFAAMKQYGSTGSVSGIGGPCDVDEFYGTAAQLRAYGAAGIAPTPPPAPTPTPPPAFDIRGWRAHAGDTGQVFVDLQRWANRCYPSYAKISPAPVYGPATAAFLAEFCRRQGVASDGKDIGPKTAALLYAAGFRG